ncbi:hypothetical protein SKAU_G00379260 [Synaphobranchus kaupii]|uniref:Uncharacterized protein n=1 Tax=Synaphobranchus kaupii TaxID=118154 RepID=A0A9Q1IEI9_SYNKA|nr:hypothetical protein SKAU_G00379260 [Synaphobranchus kaupii]
MGANNGKQCGSEGKGSSSISSDLSSSTDHTSTKVPKNAATSEEMLDLSTARDDAQLTFKRPWLWHSEELAALSQLSGSVIDGSLARPPGRLPSASSARR